MDDHEEESGIESNDSLMEVVDQADRDGSAIRKVLHAQMYKNAFNGENLHNEHLEPLKTMSEEIGRVARGWSYAYAECDRYRWSRENVYDVHAEDAWDSKSMDLFHVIDKILSTKTVEDPKWGVNFIGELLEDQAFEYKQELVEFLNYDLWLSWRYMHLRGTGFLGKEDPIYHRNKLEFEDKKRLITPLLRQAVNSAVRDGNTNIVDMTMRGLHNVEAFEEAQELLLQEQMTYNHRLMLSVSHANEFGFIPTIDTLAKAFKGEKGSQKYRDQLRSIYVTLQGEEVEAISSELEEIYNRVNFAEYALNNPDLTKREADLVERYAGNISKDAAILDIGAGVGRHSSELIQRGYKNVTAVEYQQNHIDFIRKKHPQIKAIKGSWHDLVDITAGPESYDIAYIFGRSITHNRTPQEMVHFFDQMTTVVKTQGKALVDFEDINWGARQERVQNLRNNLQRLGIKTTLGGEIFDGPNNNERFNRLVLRSEQVKTIADIFGLKVVANERLPIEGGEFDNVYYVFEKDGSFDPRNITRQDLHEALFDLGILRSKDAKVYNMYIESWGMTIGQAYIFGLDNEKIRLANQRGQGPVVSVEYSADGKINIETSTR